MLKKAGIAVAIATAGLLALTPMAFADKEDQDNTQTSTQGEGEDNGTNTGSGLSQQLCGENFSDGSGTVLQGGGECSSESDVTDQKEKQKQRNH